MQRAPEQVTAQRWLLRSPLGSSEMRLFCFPYAGVGASSYHRWPQRIGEVEVCPVQPPGRERRMADTPFASIEAFGAGAAEALLPVLDRPFALFGHCMGALLAYATAVALLERGGPQPVRLFASSSLAPHQGFFGPFHPSMSDEELTDALRQIAVSLGEPEPVPDLLALAVPILRRDVGLCFRYKPPRRALPFPVTTIGWSDDPDVRPDEMGEWRDYSEVRTHVLTGDNFSFLRGDHPLLHVLSTDLELDRERGAARAGGEAR